MVALHTSAKCALSRQGQQTAWAGAVIHASADLGLLLSD